MIIDSHAHYTNYSFTKPFRYLAMENGLYILKEGQRAQLLQELHDSGILCSVEPGVSLASCEDVLQLCSQYPGRVFPAIGIHPTRSISEKHSARKTLLALAQTPGVVAIGETGLDYHFERKEQHRLKQHIWFRYQLKLARKLNLPVILHVRNAHEDALQVLRRKAAKQPGGVVHCFTGTWDIARQYLELGYHIGIGGALLQQEDRAKALWEAVRQIPLDRILLETDAPFIHPYCKDVLPSKAVRKSRNTSLILPAVVEKIAQLKDTSAQQVEQITAENAIRLFDLPVDLCGP